MLREFGLAIALGMLLCSQAPAQDTPPTSSPPVLDLQGQLVPLPANRAAFSIEYYSSIEKKLIITGKVTDSNGMAIANATISMGSQVGGTIFTARTNSNGLFTVVIVAGIDPPKLLYLKVEGIGFSTMVMPLVLGAGQYRVQVSLSPYRG